MANYYKEIQRSRQYIENILRQHKKIEIDLLVYQVMGQFEVSEKSIKSFLKLLERLEKVKLTSTEVELR